MRPKHSNHPENAGSVRLRLLLVIAVIVPLVLVGAPPSWWSSRGVLKQGSENQANDYAPVNQGQLKHLARAAAAEMNEKFAPSGGAGSEINNLVSSWPVDQDHREGFYAPVNIGQMKAVAKPFYDRLIAMNLVVEYPWVTHARQTDARPADDHAIANIGQAKALFSFEVPVTSGIPDNLAQAWYDWLAHYGLPRSTLPDGDANGDGLSNWDKFLQGADPVHGNADSALLAWAKSVEESSGTESALGVLPGQVGLRIYTHLR